MTLLLASLIVALSLSGCGNAKRATPSAQSVPARRASHEARTALEGVPASPDNTSASAEAAAPAASLETEATRTPAAPPSITVRAGSRTMRLVPFSFGYHGYFADGPPADPPPDMGDARELFVDYLPGWEFNARFRAAGRPHARQQMVPLQRLNDRTLVLRPAGRAGVYDIELSGQAYGVGQVFTNLRWSTPVNGPLAEPEALLSVVSPGKGGRVVWGYGAALSITNLAATPKVAVAIVTVTSNNGHVTSLRATTDSGKRPVVTDEGSVALESPGVYPTSKGGSIPAAAVAALGTAPFTYAVELEFDGVRHTATARWPDDELPEDQPRVRLVFDPPLPALS